MRRFVAVAAMCLGASSALAVEPRDLHGTWRLAAATRTLVETNEVVDAYGGPHPNGWLTYGADGRMMVVCAFEGRDRPAANDRMTDDDRVRLHKSFFAYAGTYEITGQTVSHRIDTSWNEVWSGTTQVRTLEHRDRTLVLTTPPFKFNVDGKLSVLRLVWEKYP